MEPPKKCGKKLPPKKKFDFKVYKKNTINSLNNFKKFSRYVRLYKIFK